MLDAQKHEYSEVEKISLAEVPLFHPAKVFHDYWMKIKGDKVLPFRCDLVPMEIPLLLPYIVLMEIREKDGIQDYFVRLEGEYVADLSGNNARGRYISEIMTKEQFEGRHKDFSRVGAEKKPSFESGHVPFFKLHFMEVIRAVFPLTVSGEVSEQFVLIIAAKDEKSKSI